jgi:vitamin B12 transporter
MKQSLLNAALFGAVTFTPAVYADTLPEPIELNEMVVTATRTEQPLQQSLSSVTLITAKDIEASSAVDIPSILKKVAGIEFYQSGGLGKQSGLFVRGANSNQVLVLLDGVRVNSVTTGSTAIDQLMLDQIERIEIVRGNASGLYGSEAVGGMIQIFTKRGKGTPGLSLSGGIGSHNTQRLAWGSGGEVNNTAYNIQVSTVKTDGVSAIKPELVANIQPDADGYDNTSLSANVRYRFNQNHTFSATAFNSEGNNQYDTLRYDPNTFALISSPTDINISKARVSKLSLAAENRLAESWHSRVQLAQGTDDSQDFLNGAQSSAIKTTNRQFGWQNTVEINAFGSVLLGAESLRQQVAGNMAYAQTSRKANAMFAGYTGNYDAHQIQVNLRRDRYSDFGVANTGLLGYGYAISNSWRATVAASTAFKAPTFNDLYWPLSAGFQGNPKLKAERSRSLEIGFHYTGGGQQLNAAYFSTKISDLIVIDNTFSTMINLDQARNEGLEISYAGQFGNMELKAALTAQNPHDDKTGQILLRRAREFGNFSMLQQAGTWKLGGELQYSGAREGSDINTFARTTLSCYTLVNLTASHDLSNKLKLSLRADNVFKRDYMLEHGYNTLGRTLFIGVNYQP